MNGLEEVHEGMDAAKAVQPGHDVDLGWVEEPGVLQPEARFPVGRMPGDHNVSDILDLAGAKGDLFGAICFSGPLAKGYVLANDERPGPCWPDRLKFLATLYKTGELRFEGDIFHGFISGQFLLIRSQTRDTRRLSARAVETIAVELRLQLARAAQATNHVIVRRVLHRLHGR